MEEILDLLFDEKKIKNDLMRQALDVKSKFKLIKFFPLSLYSSLVKKAA